MVIEVTYTLLSDGSSDKALIPIINWTLHQLWPALLIQGNWADLSQLKLPPKQLSERIRKALELYPCDLLFIHRDSEREALISRKTEINEALEEIHIRRKNLFSVSIIPVRMMEAWLLIDEQAIKTAAGNPNSRYQVDLPSHRKLEKLPNPKEVLRNHLRQASGLSGRQLDKFNVGKAVHLVAANIIDFSLLKSLEAYSEFETDITRVLTTLESHQFFISNERAE